MLDQENKTNVEQSTTNNKLSDSNSSTSYNNLLNDHDYCTHQRTNDSAREGNDQKQMDSALSEHLMDGRGKRQRKEVHDPEFSQLSSSEYSSSDAESDQQSEYHSEDDPNRPWCSCNKPDDGNFMIECEICKYWFHGSCVGVTAAMNSRWQRERKDWFCSDCDHALQSGTPRDAIPPRLVKKEKKKVTSKSTRRRGRPRKTDVQSREVTTRQSLRSAKKMNSSLDPKMSKIKSNARIESFEKFDDQQRLKELIKERKKAFFLKHRLSEQLKVDRMKEMGLGRHSVTGSLGNSLDSLASNTSSPTMNNLPINIKSEHKERSKPNIVLQINTKKDSSADASGQRIVTAIVKRKHSDLSDTTANELFTADPIQLNKKSKNQADTTSTAPTTPKNKVSGDSTSTNGESKKVTKTEKSESTEQQSISRRKRKDSESSTANGSSKQIDSEHISQKIKECLEERGKKLIDFEMLSENIAKLASEIENELNECFKVGSTKYLSKYRSLIFNLRDAKNQALVKNVLSGEIKPSRLVRMSHDEMASHELAKWRERENKHSIELIKRDAELSFQQVIVKKTHKGEEVIVAPGPNDPDDIAAAKDDQELPTTPTKTSITSRGEAISPPTTSDGLKLDSASKKNLDMEVGEPATKTEKASPDTTTMSMDDSLAFLDTTRNHGSHVYDMNCKICTKEQSVTSPDSTKDPVAESASMKDDSKNQPQQEQKAGQPKRLRVSIETKLDPANLSLLTEPLIKPTEHLEESAEYSPSKMSPRPGSGADDHDEDNQGLYDPETSTIPPCSSILSEKPIPTEPCWSGTITMSEVGKFSALAKPVSGNLDFMKNEVSQTLLVCGRIAPDQIATYIKRLKSTTKNQILLVQLHPLTENDKSSFDSFFDYLYTRNRCGVINNGAHPQMLKDFYIMPIHEKSHIPDILKPINGPGLDRKEPNCLLGLLVKTNRPTSASSSASSYTPTSIK